MGKQLEALQNTCIVNFDMHITYATRVSSSSTTTGRRYQTFFFDFYCSHILTYNLSSVVVLN